MVRNSIIIAMLALLLIGCTEDSPTQKDGAFDLEVSVVYDNEPLVGIPVKVSTSDYTFDTQTDTTDSAGSVLFEEVLYAEYLVSTTGQVEVPDENEPNVTNTVNLDGDSLFFPGEENILTPVLSNLNPGIKINELYTGGPVNSIFYLYDQYFELYNSSDDTLYLDGMVMCRMGQYLENITYIFQFPGEPMGGTQDYPIYPGEFKVIAQDAIDHNIIPALNNGSVDLSDADFEFKNSSDYSDQDNPDVPNLDNLEVGHYLDFMVGVTSDVIILADGSDLDYLDGLDLESVVDGVEYSSLSDHEKDIEVEVDRGWAGVGQVKYQGTSLERTSPGYDTNNSTLNFEIIDSPTVGYQHE